MMDASTVLYLCDQRQCTNCSYPTCKHTLNIEHAKNFHIDFDNTYFDNAYVENEDTL